MTKRVVRATRDLPEFHQLFEATSIVERTVHGAVQNVLWRYATAEQRVDGVMKQHRLAHTARPQHDDRSANRRRLEQVEQ